MRVILVLVIVPAVSCHTTFGKVESCKDPSRAPDTFFAAEGVGTIECGVLCGRDHRCRSFSVRGVGKNSSCYHSTMRISLDVGCTNDFKHFNAYDSRCNSRGNFINSTYGCRCYDGYIGKWCERLMQDCSEGWKTDHYKGSKEAYYIQPFNSPVSFKVFCKMSNGGKTYLMNRGFGFPPVNFSRSWEEYKNGFGDYQIDGNHWAGLSMLHYVTTNRRHRFVALARFQESGKLYWRQHFYMNFTVGPEENGYRFDYPFSSPHLTGGKDRALEDGLSSFRGANFSTYDSDSDNNCADIHQSGWWWLTTCSEYNPTGQPQSPAVQNKTTDPAHMSWPHRLGYSAIFIELYVFAT
ncbi:fibrinogen-like protein 1 [Haliotis asinina]|uniref:fibrinogen-like protein 1 n=1 Tax=Haliotis asinina TaxID=109174 RepID=UPI003531BE5E